MDWTFLPTLDSERIRLRWISEHEVDAIYEIFSNPQVMRYWSTPPLENREAAAELLRNIHEEFAHRSYLKWGLALQTDDSLIGTATLFNLNLEQGRAEIGYALARSQWGKGYMQEALQRLLRYAFEELELRRIEADVDPRNVASIRTLERLGFQREGFLRERWNVAGEIQDAYFYGLLRREWQRSVN